MNFLVFFYSYYDIYEFSILRCFLNRKGEKEKPTSRSFRPFHTMFSFSLMEDTITSPTYNLLCADGFKFYKSGKKKKCMCYEVNPFSAIDDNMIDRFFIDTYNGCIHSQKIVTY